MLLLVERSPNKAIGCSVGATTGDARVVVLTVFIEFRNAVVETGNLRHDECHVEIHIVNLFYDPVPCWSPKKIGGPFSFSGICRYKILFTGFEPGTCDPTTRSGAHRLYNNERRLVTWVVYCLCRAK